MKLSRIVLTACLLVPILSVAGPASADTPCEPQARSTYRYTTTELASVFLLTMCEPMERVTFEIQVDHLNLIDGSGVTAFILGVAECRALRCVATNRWPHGNELARYDIHVFWFGFADDRIGPLVCATRNSRAGCRPLT